ncbi:MAG: O-antigen ligase family protein [bacterium]
MSSNEIGFYFEPIICICVCVFFFSRKRFVWNGWVLALLSLLLLAIVFAGTRGTWVSLIATSAFMLLRFPMKQKMKAMIAVGVLGFVFYQALGTSEYASERLATLGELGTSGAGRETRPLSSIPTRRYLMRVGLDMFLDHPLNGVGLGNYADYYHEYTSYVDNPSLQYLLKQSHTPHNFFLRFGAETGLLGLVAVGMLLSRAYRDLETAIRKRYGEPWDSILLGCYLGFIANVVHCLFQERIFGFYFWAFLGTIYVTMRHAGQSIPDRTSLEVPSRTKV